jgi:hypothetical protein
MRRTKSSSSKMATRSYDDMLLPSRETHPPALATGNISDNDSDSDDDDGRGHLIEWSSWASSIGLPLTLIEYTAPKFKQQHLQKSSRTRSQFKPSYLLQKRKQALVQHHQQHDSYLYLYSTGTSMIQMPMKSRRNSCWALLFLLTACYALFCLAKSDTTSASASLPIQPVDSAPATTYYYLNMLEDRPLEMIGIMLALHARLFELPHAQFAGVCGYPTYQQSSQQQALVMLAKLRLETILPSWDVCPPVDAIMLDDPHYVLVEEQDVERGWHVFTPKWKQWMQEYRQQRQESATVNVAVLQHYALQQQQDAMYEALWQHLISGITTTSSPNETLEQLPALQDQLNGQQPHQTQQQESVARILGKQERPVELVHESPLQSASRKTAFLLNPAMEHAESASSSRHIRRRRA